MESKNPENIKIAIIEDEQPVIKFITDFLKFKCPGCEVKSSQNIFDLASQTIGFVPDIILLDINLKGVQGFEICKMIKSQKAFRNSKILAMSAYDDPQRRQQIKKCGADDFIPKPLDMEQLLKKINQLLNDSPK